MENRLSSSGVAPNAPPPVWQILDPTVSPMTWLQSAVSCCLCYSGSWALLSLTEERCYKLAQVHLFRSIQAWLDSGVFNTHIKFKAWTCMWSDDWIFWLFSPQCHQTVNAGRPWWEFPRISDPDLGPSFCENFGESWNFKRPYLGPEKVLVCIFSAIW